MNLLLTAMPGIAGALVGGLISQLFCKSAADSKFHAAGFSCPSWVRFGFWRFGIFWRLGGSSMLKFVASADQARRKVARDRSGSVLDIREAVEQLSNAA
jgi:hypothetical protein